MDSITDILQKIEHGEMSAQEGLRRLNELESRQPETAASETIDPSKVDVVFDRAASQPPDDEENDRLSEKALQQELDGWKRWWTIPFWIGVIITVAGAGLMYWGFSAARFSWGFWLSWAPFLLGTAILTIAWRSQTARWLHVRVREKAGKKPSLVAISLPLPLKFIAWALRTFGSYIPQIKDQEIGLILETLDQSLSSKTPLYVHVNEDDADVQVYIG